MTFDLELAGPSDDESIRGLLARNPVPGRVVVSHEREPSYFDGCRATGEFTQVIVARDREAERIAAVACRSVRRLFVNGIPEDVGLLSQLRVDSAYRGRWLVSNGFAFLRTLHADRRARRYLATIMAEGRDARALLVERRRPHFPRFTPVAELATIAIAIGRERSMRRSRFEIVDERSRPSAAAAYLAEHGPSRQFFPVPSAEALAVGDALFVARRAGAVAGVLRLWDQRAFKQAVVRGYGPMLGRVRPVYNAAMRIAGRPRLPAIGEPIRLAYACSVLAEDFDALAALLRSAVNRAARAGCDYLTLGVTLDDPFVRLARSYPHIEVRSTLYDVRWDDDDPVEPLDARLPYVEVATL